MLIYNHKKEFIGIDERSLEILGFNNMADLQSVANDFADLFVKKPGYVHNFVHVNWIDFVNCAEVDDITSAIIHVNGQNYVCTLVVETAYIKEHPTDKMFLVALHNLRLADSTESIDLSQHQAPQAAPASIPEPTPSIEEEDTLDLGLDDMFTPSTEPEPISTPTPVVEEKLDLGLDDMFTPSVEEEPTPEPLLSIVEEDDKLDLGLDDMFTPSAEPEATVTPEPIVTTEKRSKMVSKMVPVIKKSTRMVTKKRLLPKSAPQPIAQNLSKAEESYRETEYIYDPQIASDELGLPVDLIEEFIEDFIAQAIEFKDGLYSAITSSDIETIKSQSHKLKGVAANLRVEDALAVLTTANHSEDLIEIQENLDVLYKIVAKLNGDEVPEEKVEYEPQSNVDEYEEYQEEEEFEEEVMEEVMEEVFEDIEIATPAPTPKATPAPEPISTPSDDLLDLNFMDEPIAKPKPSYSIANISSEIGIPQNIFKELFDDYMAESVVISNNIKSAIDTNNDLLWRQEAIKFKGMSDNMRVSKLASHLEAIINTHSSSVASSELEEIENIVQKIKQEER